MKKSLVSQAVAKLAKEKGFRVPTNGRYYWDPEYMKIMFSKKGAIKCGNCDDSTAVPKQTRLQKWLREVHKIHIEIIWDYGDVIWFPSISYIGNLEKSCIDIIGENKTYEDALEIGLMEALKLIK